MSATMPERLRLWYEHERDSNQKMLAMIESVPAGNRTDPRFQQAVDLAVHLYVARDNWLNRIHGRPDPSPDWFPKGTPVADLPAMFERVETAWVDYLSRIDDTELARWFEWGARSGSWKGTVDVILVQVKGHAWYHRGQIALLVDQLGGEAVDSDFIFWSGRTQHDPARVEP